MPQMGVPVPPSYWDDYKTSTSLGSDLARILGVGLTDLSESRRKERYHQDELGLDRRRVDVLESEERRRGAEESSPLSIDLESMEFVDPTELASQPPSEFPDFDAWHRQKYGGSDVPGEWVRGHRMPLYDEDRAAFFRAAGGEGARRLPPSVMTFPAGTRPEAASRIADRAKKAQDRAKVKKTLGPVAARLFPELATDPDSLADFVSTTEGRLLFSQRAQEERARNVAAAAAATKAASDQAIASDWAYARENPGATYRTTKQRIPNPVLGSVFGPQTIEVEAKGAPLALEVQEFQARQGEINKRRTEANAAKAALEEVKAGRASKRDAVRTFEWFSAKADAARTNLEVQMGYAGGRVPKPGQREYENYQSALQASRLWRAAAAEAYNAVEKAHPGSLGPTAGALFTDEPSYKGFLEDAAGEEEEILGAFAGR